MVNVQSFRSMKKYFYLRPKYKFILLSFMSLATRGVKCDEGAFVSIGTAGRLEFRRRDLFRKHIGLSAALNQHGGMKRWATGDWP